MSRRWSSDDRQRFTDRDATRKEDAARNLRGPHRVAAAPRNARQASVAAWCTECFGPAELASLPQRGLRLLEEAIEAYQAAGGNPTTAHRLVDHVFSRGIGELAQELGGVGVTLLALAHAAGLSADVEEAVEVQRVQSMSREHFRLRNAEKAKAGFNFVVPTAPAPLKLPTYRITVGDCAGTFSEVDVTGWDATLRVRDELREKYPDKVCSIHGEEADGDGDGLTEEERGQL